MERRINVGCQLQHTLTEENGVNKVVTINTVTGQPVSTVTGLYADRTWEHLQENYFEIVPKGGWSNAD